MTPARGSRWGRGWVPRPDTGRRVPFLAFKYRLSWSCAPEPYRVPVSVLSGTQGVQMARSATGPRKRPVQVLTSAEIRALLRQCSVTAPTGIRNRALITVMYRGGLRLDEALELRPADVNPANGAVRILH